MSVYDQDKKPKANRIFISYSSLDRIRTNGLSLLLEAMGHQVFHDHRTIKPGMSWKAALQDGLDDADAFMVFWTRHASRSDWVRKEYEYFAAQYPDRLLVPVIGDETPLAELLKTRQQADFVPVVNEVLDMKRQMKKAGASAGQIEAAVSEKLGENGVEVKTSHQKRLLFLFLGFGWLLSLLRYPGSMFRRAGNRAVEKTAQATTGQVAVIAMAAVAGGSLAYPVAKSVVEEETPTEIAELVEENKDLQASIEDFENSRDDLLALDGKLDGLQNAIAALHRRVDQPLPPEPPISCVTPQDFAACQSEISSAKVKLDSSLTGISRLLGRLPNINTVGAGEQGGAAEVVESSANCDSDLEPLLRPEPGYPVRARAQQIEADVTVSATVDVDGTVIDAVAENDADPLLANAAVEAMRNWTFTRCTVGGNPVPAEHRVIFKFSLRD